MKRAGLIEQPKPKPRYTLAQLEASEWSAQFERFMRNRLIMGALRYGTLGSPQKKKYNRILGIQKRLDQYALSGNLENLVDIANLALVEYVEGDQPNRHWDALHGDHCGIEKS